ncbi:isoprenylcysteine carboxylmethyltransferase family protein [Mesorhizobium sp. M1D.F.Ca.ET.184.01.1.1]|nr:isoprenylcysteine carboxylmethyltransferase family protein [Mesorhizobium sp. M1D.F.Ca.ET.231.01.1.1]TGP27832.1 isoprenylcysteine carboxylmethyltransferase family protein [Mesorhizobium sp. M1D.F.Ca.ET.234.01.1.1]TGS42182.1 isoprenylcysteine carboxylmethyltransferase family protein [Mesorhizobium sp. M1D.F.Ca.ET.184.01.1.1]TGS59533.1 isoprenylcysteine carboxylmethyltransferase family protein [Mesorhizobium sp. M1D.F.Ca.ET.183.01.1.1]TIT79400.1 MAG: isoprenylcysteine carboxylmethyltransferase
MAMSDEEDNPGVAVFPPLLFLVTVILMLALRYIWPLAIGGRPATLVLGLVLAALAIAGIAWGRMTMQRGGTNIDPTKPTLAIITGGPFGYSRNPLYVGLMGLLLGIGLVFDTWWGVVALVPVSLILHSGVVLREEAYLERKFGEPYRAYKASVRRYL